MEKIATLTLNPALDHYCYLEGIERGEVNRVLKTETYVGGKGINVSLALQHLGIESTIFGCIGGNNGRIIKETLERQGLKTSFFEVLANTRQNIKLIELSQNIITEINTAGSIVTKTELEQLRKKLAIELLDFSEIVLSGSMPPGIASDFYADLIGILNANKKRVFFDADGEQLRLGVAARPFLIKPNRHELEEFLGKKDLSRKDLLQAARSLLASGINYVVISDGAEGALFAKNEEAWWAEGSKIEAASTVGAGDALLSGIIAGFIRGLSLPEIAKYSLAVANAKVALQGTTFPEAKMIKEMVGLIKIELL